MFTLMKLSCGGSIALDVNEMIPQLTSTLITLIKVGVPILLIVFGMLDLGKAVMAQKEDEIKKGWQTFIKRIVAAAVVFLVIFIVQIVFSLVAGNDKKDSIWHCVDCFVNNDCENAQNDTK